jgi:hypothetical protein
MRQSMCTHLVGAELELVARQAVAEAQGHGREVRPRQPRDQALQLRPHPARQLHHRIAATTNTMPSCSRASAQGHGAVSMHRQTDPLSGVGCKLHGATWRPPEMPMRGVCGKNALQLPLAVRHAHLLMHWMPIFSLTMLPSLASSTARVSVSASTFFFKNFFKPAACSTTRQCTFRIRRDDCGHVRGSRRCVQSQALSWLMGASSPASWLTFAELAVAY